MHISVQLDFDIKLESNNFVYVYRHQEHERLFALRNVKEYNILTCKSLANA
jgi:hypothetical protein